MVTFLGALVVGTVLLVAYFGAEGPSMLGADPREARTVRERLVAALASLMAATGRRLAAHRRAWESYDAALRPWEHERSS